MNVRDLQYGLARVKVPDTDEAYYYVPAVTLWGSFEFTGKKDGEIYSRSINADGGDTIRLLILNAVDGTIIP